MDGNGSNSSGSKDQSGSHTRTKVTVRKFGEDALASGFGCYAMRSNGDGPPTDSSEHVEYLFYKLAKEQVNNIDLVLFRTAYRGRIGSNIGTCAVDLGPYATRFEAEKRHEEFMKESGSGLYNIQFSIEKMNKEKSMKLPIDE